MIEEKDFPQFRLGNVVRTVQGDPRVSTERVARVRGIVTGLDGVTHVSVLWPATPSGGAGFVEMCPVETVEIESESIAFLTKKLIAGEEEAKKELGLEFLNKAASGALTVQGVKDMLSAWDIPVPNRRFRAKVHLSFMAEATYAGGFATVNQSFMTEGFKVDDDASTEILVSMEDEEWVGVVLDDPYLRISDFEEVEEEEKD